MSRATADIVDAVQLAARSATLQHELVLADLPRLTQAGALPGTEAHAQLRFSQFEGRPAVELRVEGTLVLSCQRCLQPLQLAVDEAVSLAIVPDEDALAPLGFEPHVADAGQCSLSALVEEQLLLGLPLVPMHDEDTTCGRNAGRTHAITRGPTPAAVEDRQRPFSNLRELLGSDEQ